MDNSFQNPLGRIRFECIECVLYNWVTQKILKSISPLDKKLMLRITLYLSQAVVPRHFTSVMDNRTATYSRTLLKIGSFRHDQEQITDIFCQMLMVIGRDITLCQKYGMIYYIPANCYNFSVATVFISALTTLLRSGLEMLHTIFMKS